MSNSVLCMFSSSFLVSDGGLVTMSDSCNPIDCSLPGSSVHGILHARILEWVAISLPRVSSQPRNQTWVSCLAGRFFTDWATREAQVSSLLSFFHTWYVKIFQFYSFTWAVQYFQHHLLVILSFLHCVFFTSL